MGLMMHLFASESVALVIGIFYILWFSGLLGSTIPFPVVVPSPYYELYMVYIQGRQLIDIRDIHYQVVSLGTAKILGIEIGQMMVSLGVLPVAEVMLPIVQLWLSPVLMTSVSVMLLRMVASGGRCPEELLRYPPLRYPIANAAVTLTDCEQEGVVKQQHESPSPHTTVPDRTILVTGANGTAGFNLCRDLIERAYSTGNLRLIILCRTDEKCERAVESLKKISLSSQERLGIHPMAVQALRDSGAWRNITIEHFGGCDFSDFNAIRKYITRLENLQNVSKAGLASSAANNNIRTLQSLMILNIDTVVNTVGTIARTPRYFSNTTASNHQATSTTLTEANIASNSVGVHLFVTSMMPLLRKTAQRTGVPSRVVITASSCHRHLGFGKCMTPIQMLKALHPSSSSTTITAKPSTSPLKHPNATYCIKAGRSVFGLNYVKIYGLSKLMNVYTTLHLVKQSCVASLPSGSAANQDVDDAIPSYYSTILPSDKEVFITMCHPGVFVSTLYTEVVFGFTFIMNVIIKPISYLFFKTGPESAQTLLYLTTALPPSSHPTPSMHVACERQISRIRTAINQVSSTSDPSISKEQKELLASHITAFKDITTLSFFNSSKSSIDDHNENNSGSQSKLSPSELDAVKTVQSRYRSIQGGYYFDCKEYGITSPVAVCVSKNGQDEKMGAECVKWMESRY